MLKIENVVPPSPQQMKMVILGARNSWSSRDKSDSHMVLESNETDILVLGHNDKDLLERLSNGNTAESKYLRMMHVIFDMTAPLYFWKQFDTYKVGTVSNSESTMHTLAKNPIKKEDFSLDYDWVDEDIKRSCIGATLEDLEHYRQMFKESGDKRWWTLLIQMLPESYNQKRTIDINYATIKNIVNQRRGHKLSEWQEFIHYMYLLPYAFLMFTEQNKPGPDFLAKNLNTFTKEEVRPNDIPSFMPKRMAVPVKNNANEPRYESMIVHKGEPFYPRIDFDLKEVTEED